MKVNLKDSLFMIDNNRTRALHQIVHMSQKNILVIGAGGQIGTVLAEKLKEVYGASSVFATDLKENPDKHIQEL